MREIVRAVILDNNYSILALQGPPTTADINDYNYYVIATNYLSTLCSGKTHTHVSFCIFVENV